jgi:hypothetical protein
MEIKKDKRSAGHYHQKNGDVKGSWKTKVRAMKDIARCIREGDDYFTKNYIPYEYIVMKYVEYPEDVISL